MTSSPGQRRVPPVGATFYPGGTDDFYMPEVISPAPQRIMPEVPEQIQDNLAHLELEGDQHHRLSGLQSPSPPVAEMPGSSAPPTLLNRYSDLSISTVSTEPPRAPAAHGANQNPAMVGSPTQRKQDSGALDQPTFSPFPVLHNRPANVPPSDAEREIILESARLPVLGSNDPEMQLTWAQDTLAYVEVAAQNQLRDFDSQESRPQTPRIEYQLRQDAINVVNFLADQFHPKADFIKGMWLEFGKFQFRMDKREAYKCYRRAGEKGYARAEYRIGMQFEASNDIVKAIKHYTQGVEAGDSASHYRLGMMTLLGQHGQPLDYERGIGLIKFAAATADENAPQGAYVLGMLQSRELAQVNVPEQYLPLNITEARYNIEKAAYLGFAKAQTKMGSAYELCQLGCDFDPSLSLHYNALAARQGEPEAEMSISKWFLCGYEGVFEKNEELAFSYARRATSSGFATAEFAMGYFYEIGMYVPVDLKAAREWYGKASDHGNKDAAARIDGIGRSNTLSKKDHVNVAIARIQSQYGSQKGKRPERFKNNSTPLPTIPDAPLDMPDPHESRPGEARPYPHPSTTGTPSRPVSVAPYPMDDGPPRLKPANVTTYPHGNLRLDADSRRSSAANVHPTAVDGNYRRDSPALVGPHRPASSTGDVAYGRGRGRPTFNTAPGGQGYRQPSGNLPSPPLVGSGGVNHPRPQSSGVDIGYTAPHGFLHGPGHNATWSTGPPSTRANPPETNRPPTTGIDIGFSAPPDPSGADRRRRLQKAETPAGGAARHDTGLNRNAPRTSSLPHAQTFSGVSRTDSPGQNPVLSSKYHDTLPHPAGPGQPDDINAPLMPPKALASDPVSTTPPPGATSRPPGKGPKTFEDMNIPQAKKESECVLM